MAPQLVKGYVKSNKNDYADAEAICEVGVHAPAVGAALRAVAGARCLYPQLPAQLNTVFKQQEVCQRLAAIKGIGPLTAMAVVGSFGNGRQFPNGRQFAAALGLVPRQHGTGGKVYLLGISKRGDRDLRTLLVHGARSAVRAVLSKDKPNARSCWIKWIA